MGWEGGSEECGIGNCGGDTWMWVSCSRWMGGDSWWSYPLLRVVIVSRERVIIVSWCVCLMRCYHAYRNGCGRESHDSRCMASSPEMVIVGCTRGPHFHPHIQNKLITIFLYYIFSWNWNWNLNAVFDELRIVLFKSYL